MAGAEFTAQPVLVVDSAGLGSSVRFGAEVAAAVELYGLSLGVSGAEVSVGIAFVDSQGNPALVLEPKVKTPTSAHVELDLPMIRAGGMLRKTAHDWRGALTADLGVATVTGFGILGTDDPPSFVVLLAGEFAPPIQLSFGFTLVGVGGLVGINRTVDPQQLSAAVTSGTAADLLFPRDPVGDADRILQTLDTCFPRRRGGFVVGPMLKLGWGTPTLVSATAAVLVSDRGVDVLGRLLVALPHEDLALIRIEALIHGRVDGEGLAIDAALVDSRIGFVAIEGEFRLRARGGDDAYFALSAGGFNPAFEPPRGMGGMRRLSAELRPCAILDLRLEAYVAVTPNTAQFGARLEITAGTDGWGLHGTGSFDALFMFFPFRFSAQLSASVEVEIAGYDVAGVALRLALSGPSKWRASGSGTVSVLGFEADIDLPEISWGQDPSPDLPDPRDPAAVLAYEIERRENWGAVPGDVPHLVQLAERRAEAFHPLDLPAFRQRAVPIGVAIQRMDGVPLPAPVTLAVLDGGTVLPPQDPQKFVSRMFFDVDDVTQRSSAGFLDHPGGVALAPVPHRVGGSRAAPTGFSEKVLEETS
jgi:hypothetical protein